jgi:hypothetical protein
MSILNSNIASLINNNFHVVTVQYPQGDSFGGKMYDYKVPKESEVVAGDIVTVYTPSGEYINCKVCKVKDSYLANMNKIQYKWIVGVVPVGAYKRLVAEDERIAKLAQKMRQTADTEKMRRELYKEVLGSVEAMDMYKNLMGDEDNYDIK